MNEMDGSVKSVEAKKFREIPIQNPFLREFHVWNRENEFYDKVKVSTTVREDECEARLVQEKRLVDIAKILSTHFRAMCIKIIICKYTFFTPFAKLFERFCEEKREMIFFPRKVKNKYFHIRLLISLCHRVRVLEISQKI